MKKLNKKIFLLLLFVLNVQQTSGSHHPNDWGFFGHQLINRNAVFLLPEEMFGFYKQNIDYLVKSSTKPDMRRYMVEAEGVRHYIDLDIYKAKTDSIPKRWSDAVSLFSIDTLETYGIVPWHVERMRRKLTKAFETRNQELILKYSAEIGHYIADAHVPLHTCSNYNGQLSDQYGIHGLWESRIVELFSDEYDFILDEASYLYNPSETIWNAVYSAHQCLDSVFKYEKIATEIVGSSSKYAYVERNRLTVKTYSKNFSEKYHTLLENQVERRMRMSIQCVANYWFTSWVDAGQPSLEFLQLEAQSEEEAEKKEVKPSRLHDYE